jgi:hypothetical protein
MVSRLLRGLQPRVSPVERGDVTEFTGKGTATGILNAPEQILTDVYQAIGRRRKIGHRKAGHCAIYDLLLGTHRSLVDPAKQFERPITHFAAM